MILSNHDNNENDQLIVSLFSDSQFMHGLFLKKNLHKNGISQCRNVHFGQYEKEVVLFLYGTYTLNVIDCCSTCTGMVYYDD